MSLRNSFIAQFFYNFLEKSILPKLAKTNIHPNHFTILGFGIAFMVPLCFFIHPMLGLLFIILSGISDTMDGLLARHLGKASNLGAFLDSSLDRFSDFCFLFGFWVLFWHTDKVILASALIFASMFFTLFISYIKARAASIGLDLDAGIMDRGLRTVYLIVWALLLGIFPSVFQKVLWSGLVLFCTLCLLTVIQRLYHVSIRLNDQDPG